MNLRINYYSDFFPLNCLISHMLMLLLILCMQRKNINCSILESLQRFEAVCEAARKNSVPVRG